MTIFYCLTTLGVVQPWNVTTFPMRFTSFQSSPVNCCWPSPAQSFIVPSHCRTHDHILLSHNSGSSATVEGHYISYEVHFIPVQFSKLLLVLASTAGLDFGLCRDPCPYILLCTLLCIKKWGLLLDERSLTAATTGHSHSTGEVNLLACTLTHSLEIRSCEVGNKFLANFPKVGLCNPHPLCVFPPYNF
jgi:hypothetical protein